MYDFKIVVSDKFVFYCDLFFVVDVLIVGEFDVVVNMVNVVVLLFDWLLGFNWVGFY